MKLLHARTHAHFEVAGNVGFMRVRTYSHLMNGAGYITKHSYLYSDPFQGGERRTALVNKGL